MEIKRCGSQPSGKGPADYFTGTVRIDPLFDARDPQRVSGASVTFEPGARTAWHTHPLGQTLIVTAGRPVVASVYSGSVGVPALFSRTVFAELTRLEDGCGAKEVIKRHASEAHFLPFPSGAVGVDTADEFSRLIAEDVA